MKRSLCLFEPLDVLVNADSRRMDQGGWGQQGDIAPHAFAGALRTAVLRSSGYDLSKRLKDQHRKEALNAAAAVGVPGAGGEMTFRFAGPLLTNKWQDLLFPTPECFHGVSLRTRLSPRTGVLTDSGLAPCCVLRTSHREQERNEGLLTTKALCFHLAKAADRDDELAERMEKMGHSGPPAKPPYGAERLWGHTRSETGAVAESALFSRGALRFEQSSGTRLRSAGYAGLLGGVDARELDGEHVRLGGDGHMARLIIQDLDKRLLPVEHLREIVLGAIKKPETFGVLLYLATPAIFEKGWDPSPLLAGSGLTLVGAALRPPQIFAGWDMEKRAPKPPRRAVRAGTTYFLDVTDAPQAAEFVQRFHLNEMFSQDQQDGRLGYGLALFGVWNRNERDS